MNRGRRPSRPRVRMSGRAHHSGAGQRSAGRANVQHRSGICYGGEMTGHHSGSHHCSWVPHRSIGGAGCHRSSRFGFVSPGMHRSHCTGYGWHHSWVGGIPCCNRGRSIWPEGDPE
ncbi:hypothetical protein [Paenibacillus senegalensis]|uniref:hypothetical protein n=1 Tax=Paenibacillus senegalensis TaxID=1465766 RepID=UPI000288EEB7|nr:hypothetical protein [Paenibacillus senegalensis]